MKLSISNGKEFHGSARSSDNPFDSSFCFGMNLFSWYQKWMVTKKKDALIDNKKLAAEVNTTHEQNVDHNKDLQVRSETWTRSIIRCLCCRVVIMHEIKEYKINLMSQQTILNDLVSQQAVVVNIGFSLSTSFLVKALWRNRTR